MKAIIYYFSATGNSLATARALADRISGTELHSIPDVMKSATVPTADVIGLVFPVYMFGVPPIVARFCRRLRASNKPYVFGVATGRIPGATLIQLRDLLFANGLILSAGFVVGLPDNYTPLQGAPSQARQEKMFAAARTKIEKIVDAVRKRAEHPPEASNQVLNAILTGVLYRRCSRFIPGMDRHFLTTDRCDGCGTCARVCPVENIRMQNGRPVWLHHCEQCLACLHWCPETAIEFGASTRRRKRYHHPDVTVQDFMHR
jgi:ferredoxin